MFGTLPEGNFFLDDPNENPLPDAMRTQILNASLGETVWIGPVSGAFLYGFENANTPKRIMIAASKSVDVRYGECYGLLLIDESIFEKIFTSIQNGTSNWYLFTPRKTEIYHTGEESCMHPDRLINESNTGKIFDDDDGNPICTFSMTLTSPPWTMLRKVDMDDYELLVKVIRRVHDKQHAGDCTLLAGDAIGCKCLDETAVGGRVKRHNRGCRFTCIAGGRIQAACR